MLPSDRDTPESLNREGSCNCSGSIQTNPIVRIMYIMLNSKQPQHILNSEFSRETQAVDEARRILLISQLVFHVLDIGGQGHVTVDDKPVVGFGDL